MSSLTESVQTRKPFLTSSEIKKQFGSYTEQALQLLTEKYPMLEYDPSGLYYFKIDLELLNETNDLFQVDKELVNHEIELYPIFSDQEVDPDILSNLMDLMEEKVGYSGVNNSGYLCLNFSDIRRWYGPSFDTEMQEKYHSYSALQEWLEHVEHEEKLLA